MIRIRGREVTATSDLWIPGARWDLPYDDARRWYANIDAELSLITWSSDLRMKFIEYYRDAGLLDRPRKRAFFDHHYARPLALAVREIAQPPRRNRLILDLGCGLGTQSLLFALLGAKVVGIDLDAKALQIASTRCDFYAERARRPLAISFQCADASTFDYGGYGPFDAVYSLFAFNMMQPSQALLDRLIPHLVPEAVIIIQDGNRKMLYARIFRRRRVLSAAEFRQALEQRGFRDVRSIPGYALPPVAWCVLPTEIARPIDAMLGRSPLFAGSYLHIARLAQKEM